MLPLASRAILWQDKQAGFALAEMIFLAQEELNVYGCGRMKVSGTCHRLGSNEPRPMQDWVGGSFSSIAERGCKQAGGGSLQGRYCSSTRVFFIVEGIMFLPPRLFKLNGKTVELMGLAREESLQWVSTVRPVSELPLSWKTGFYQKNILLSINCWGNN